MAITINQALDNQLIFTIENDHKSHTITTIINQIMAIVTDNIL